MYVITVFMNEASMAQPHATQCTVNAMYMKYLARVCAHTRMCVCIKSCVSVRMCSVWGVVRKEVQE